MEKKHQVFVSSTYKDLIEERKEVIHALLELDCIPAGMELFPATDEDAWSLITEVIDGCDYYLLIIAGKYGSLNSEGVGYTEMEFDYAVATDKPIICFLHEDIQDLPASKVESSAAGKKRLEKFRKKAQEKHCKFWSSSADLGGKASRSLIQLKKKHPSEGWVRARYAADPALLAEIEMLRAQVQQYEFKNVSDGNVAPDNFEELEHGDDIYYMPNKLYLEKGGVLEVL